MTQVGRLSDDERWDGRYIVNGEEFIPTLPGYQNYGCGPSSSALDNQGDEPAPTITWWRAAIEWLWKRI